MSPTLTTSTAFDLLRDEVDARLAQFHTSISEASARHDYEAVGHLAKAAQEVAGLKDELAALERRFGALVEADPELPHGEGPAEGKHFKKGLKTPERAYQQPILQALVDLGGSSELHAVLDRVYAMMQGQLNSHDLAPLPSDGVTPRWQNTARSGRAMRCARPGTSGAIPHTASGRSRTRGGRGWPRDKRRRGARRGALDVYDEPAARGGPHPSNVHGGKDRRAPLRMLQLGHRAWPHPTTAQQSRHTHQE